MNARTKERCRLFRFCGTATLDREFDVGDIPLFGFFITAREAVFGQLGGYITRDEDNVKWRIGHPAKMVAWLRSAEGKADINVDARMFKFWYFATLVLFYIILWNLFAIVMRSLGVGRIDPLVIPGLFMLVSAIRFGSIGICLLILHLIFRSSRKRAFGTAFVTLVSAVESFLEIEVDSDDLDAYRNAIVDVIPEVDKGLGLTDIHHATRTEWRINHDMDDDEKNDLRSTIYAAGFDEHLVDYQLESKTLKPVGYILRAGSKIQISLTPRSDGTQIDFWSDLSGFVTLLSMITPVIALAVAGTLIALLHVVKFGATGKLADFYHNLFWYSLFIGIGLWNAVRAVILSLRRAKIKRGASRLVGLLEKKEEAVDQGNAPAEQMPGVREGESGRQTEVLDHLSRKVGIDDSGMRHIGKLYQLTELDLGNANITDTGLAHIRSLTNLHELDLSENRITDVGLSYLRGMTKLRKLNLEQNRVTEDGLQQLINCPNLDRLEVDQRKIKLMPVIRTGGAHLFSDIRILNLSDQNVTDEDLKYQREFDVLMLDLHMNQITGTGLRYLESVSTLRSLNIAFKPLKTEMLSHLKIHRGLEQLHIRNTNVDEEGILDLKRHMPWLKIWSDYEHTGSFFFRFRMALYGVKGRILKMFGAHE